MSSNRTKQTRARKTTAATATKTKLRTAADVISRLRWDRACVGEDAEDIAIMIGYDDRINGPMEKNLDDFTGIEHGGDIPEHRIWYLRLDTVDDIVASSTIRNSGSSTARQKRQEQAIENCILWDRIGRVDRVFSSGYGANGAISPDTIQHVEEAVITLRRLEEEKMERKLQKQQMRARKARRRAVVNKEANPVESNLQNSVNAIRTSNTVVSRYSLEPIDWYSFSSSEEAWVHGSSKDGKKIPSRTHNPTLSEENKKLVVVSWNVLFDLFDDSTDKDVSGGEHTQRWERLADHLAHTNADIIALQEVTPRFVHILLSKEWVMSNYSTTASPSNVMTVSPCGNLLLWRTSYNGLNPVSSKLGAFSCLDGQRNRSIITSLQFTGDKEVRSSSIILIANVHLPADKKSTNNTGEEQTSNRDLARRRELGAIIGHLQKMEDKVRSYSKCDVATMIVGDFNTADMTTGCFADGNFSGSPQKGAENKSFFIDAWPQISSQPGYTYDPHSNELAAKNREAVNGTFEPRRLDRIFIARCWQPSSTYDGDANMVLKPTSGALLQEKDGSPPLSDHSGVMIELEVPSNRRSTSLYCSKQPGCNAWAANAINTPDTLLGIIVDDATLKRIKAKYDDSSSLPIPHVTLLHGFVELLSLGSLSLAKEAIENALETVREEIDEHEWHLTFDRSSIGIFEHNSSATLIGRPSNNVESSHWLSHLYKTLRQSFRLCHEQESHRHGGKWDPHVTLGSFGTPQAARSALLNILQECNWGDKQVHRIPVHGLTIFKRDPMDGKFVAVSTIPFSKKTRCLDDFTRDAGLSAMHRMKGLCSPILSEVERACQEYVNTKENLSASVEIYGSYLMNTCVPEMSDVDVVLKLRPASLQNTTKNGPANSKKMDRNEVLSGIASILKSRYVNANVRIRSAGNNTMLTIKLWQGAPMIDMCICFCDFNGHPADDVSDEASAAIDDTTAILDAIQQCYQDNIAIVPIFEGALRIIKYWAYCRGIYGSQTGFLGGGGWAIWLAAIMCGSGVQNGNSNLSFPVLDKKVNSRTSNHLQGTLTIAECSRQLVGNFFKEAVKWPYPIVAHLSKDLLPKGTHHRQYKDSTRLAAQEATERAMSRGSIAIIAPITQGNHGRNSTRSTTMIVRTELQRAAAFFSHDCNIPTRLFDNQSLRDFLTEFSAHIVYEISVSSLIDRQHQQQQLNAKKPSDIKGWGTFRVLHLLVDIEQRYSEEVSKLRPRGRILRVPSGTSASNTIITNCEGCTWIWFVGVSLLGDSSRVDGYLRDRLHEERNALKESSGLANNIVSCSISLLTSDEAIDKIEHCL